VLRLFDPPLESGVGGLPRHASSCPGGLEGEKSLGLLARTSVFALRIPLPPNRPVLSNVIRGLGTGPDARASSERLAHTPGPRSKSTSWGWELGQSLLVFNGACS